MENGFSTLKSLRNLSKAVLALLPLTAAGLLSAAHAAPLAPEPAPEHIPGEMVVKVRQNGPMTLGAKKEILSSRIRTALGQGQILAIDGFQTDSSLFKVKIKDDAALQMMIESFENEPAIEFAEPNFIYRTMQSESNPTDPVSNLPNDPEFSKLWGIQNVGQADSAGQVGTAGSDIGVVPLWQKGLTGSKDILVAVIDTGIDHTHPDLAANVFTNAGEIAGNGIDDDKNGFVDDVHGWNFEAKSSNAKDDHDHGSHCAGTIGGTGNNGIGVVGVNWNVTMLPVKFLSASGSGSLQGAIESINYARMMKVNIMSNSWGGGGFSQALMDSIVAAKEAGIVFVAAAGNESNNNDAKPTYPASYDVDNIISVAATDNRDTIAKFSNYGAARVHVAAPGVKVFSTTKDGKYAAFSGTSMATPHVAGIAALMLADQPTLTYQEVKARLIQTSVPVKGLKRKVLAKGRVSAFNAVNGIIPPTDEPSESLWQTVDYAVESEHPYKNAEDKTFTVNYPGAKYIRVIFERIQVEMNYDRITVMDSSRAVMEDLTGNLANHTSEYVAGDTVLIRLKSDNTANGFGFKVSKIQVIPQTE